VSDSLIISIRNERESKALALADQWEGDALDPAITNDQRHTLLTCASQLRNALRIDWTMSLIHPAYRCDYCDFATTSYNEYEEHMATHKGKAEP
jgi:hypothetical protein